MSLATLQRPPIHRTGQLSDQIYRALTGRQTDAAPMAWLAHVLGATETELRLTAATTPHLGICQGALLYCLPPQPLAAGFQICRHDGWLSLRLPARGLRAPLIISGRHVGPTPSSDRDQVLGAGELAYAIGRLTLMAGNWLPPAPDPTRLLFELIADAWRHSTRSTRGGRFTVHHAEFTEPVARTGAHRLRLVTNRGRLINLYPVPTKEQP